MAVQGRGYYGIGAAKKDFGFTKNMSLPLNRRYEWPSMDGTPMEGGSKKKGRAKFAVEREDQVSECIRSTHTRGWVVCTNPSS